ncbi:MAG: molecular chaperone TorD family protein [Rhizobiaceae bacterium]|nr:molecular chaperone TorD family protein [Rhizobiaceae bacterium]
MRADLYGLLGKLLFAPPDQNSLNALAALSGDETEMGQAFNALAKLAAATPVATVRQEYDGLFIGMGRGELLPYGSYYLTGFLNEKPLAKLRNSMAALGIARHDEIKEPEDHIGSLMEMMAGLIAGRYGEPASLDMQREFFTTHIEPWATHFYKDLEAAELSRFYQPVGTLGRLFMEIELDAFSME